MITVQVQVPIGGMPIQATPGAAGFDLRAAIKESIWLHPAHDGVLRGSSDAHAIIPTGIRLAIPPGYEGQVRPRSGLAAKHGITVLNTPGTIDSDYRGEVKVILINHGSIPYEILPGDRIAQLVICPVPVVRLVRVDVLDDTERSDGGLGSTGR